ncbi:DoxX family protein [Halogeometricum borinquense]|uniref:DoxX family protein n=1 Tax=Halogeometricum borinquense TaxID=60847 RepID=UPI00343ABF96
MTEDSRETDVSSLLLRLGLGVVFAVHGFGKLDIGPLANGAGVSGVTGFFTQLGIPLPGIMAWIVTLVEVVGGLLLLLGVFTRVASFLLAVDMAVATVLVHLPNGFGVGDGGVEFTLVLFLGVLALVFLGPGRYSLEVVVLGRELVPSLGEETLGRSV